MIIPQAMAYAFLAGMPPIYGMCKLVPKMENIPKMEQKERKGQVEGRKREIGPLIMIIPKPWPMLIFAGIPPIYGNCKSALKRQVSTGMRERINIRLFFPLFIYLLFLIFIHKYLFIYFFVYRIILCFRAYSNVLYFWKFATFSRWSACYCVYFRFVVFVSSRFSTSHFVWSLLSTSPIFGLDFSFRRCYIQLC
jgi:hypothetical protein